MMKCPTTNHKKSHGFYRMISDVYFYFETILKHEMIFHMERTIKEAHWVRCKKCPKENHEPRNTLKRSTNIFLVPNQRYQHFQHIY